jgi:hypothetical protein
MLPSGATNADAARDVLSGPQAAAATTNCDRAQAANLGSLRPPPSWQANKRVVDAGSLLEVS